MDDCNNEEAEPAPDYPKTAEDSPETAVDSPTTASPEITLEGISLSETRPVVDDWTAEQNNACRRVSRCGRFWICPNFPPVPRFADVDPSEYSRAFGRQANPTRNQNAPPSRGNTSSPSAYSQQNPIGAGVAAAPPSPSISQSIAHNDQAHQTNANEGRIPLFFREKYAGLVVKGNFDTLAVTPALVDEGEWLGHQLVEQARLMGNMITVVIDKVDKTAAKSVCTEQTCPTMTASPGVVYTWVDTQRNPIHLPAAQYIKNIQTWVNGKIANPSLFPTDTFSSAPPPGTRLRDLDPNDRSRWLGQTYGFPQSFYNEVKNLYKQMFRCYAHLYWAHWMCFWDLECYRELNTCFVHFNNVGRRFGLLSDKDTEPMQGLINLWVQQGTLPKLVTEEAASAAGGSAGNETAADAPA